MRNIGELTINRYQPQSISRSLLSL